MDYQIFIFLLFSFVLLLNAMYVINARNPIHSVICLIGCFIATAGLFILLRAEFLAMLLVIVYVGAIAVMFLFFIMTSNTNISMLQNEVRQNFWFIIMNAVVISLGILYIITSDYYNNYNSVLTMIKSNSDLLINNQKFSNTRNIGNVLYTNFFVPFQLCGLILLVAMVGAVVLVYDEKAKDKGRKQVNVAAQVARKRRDSIRVVKVTTGAGVASGKVSE